MPSWVLNGKSTTNVSGTRSPAAFTRDDVAFTDYRGAHMALVRLLQRETPKDERLSWRHQLRKQQVTANIRDFSAAVNAALREKVVYHIFHQVPLTLPDYVARPVRPVNGPREG